MEYNNEELNGGTNYSGPIYVERRGSGCLGNGLKIGCGFIAGIFVTLPKDSVILLLGQPTEFMSTDYIDEITYRYGNYDINSLRIEFEDGKVNSVTQH